jgi:cobalamin biosynthesis protein CbiD
MLTSQLGYTTFLAAAAAAAAAIDVDGGGDSLLS